MKTLIITTILLTTFSFNGITQEASRREAKGEKLFFAHSYDNAIKQYNKAEQLTINGQRNLAASYERTNQHNLANNMYKLIVNNTSGVEAEDYYNYAMSQKSLGNYTEAAIWMDKFQMVKPNDLRAKSYVANKSNLAALMTNNDKNKIAHLDFNTDAQEFGTTYYKNDVIYSSSSAGTGFIKRTNNSNGKPYLNLYSSMVNGEQLDKGQRFDKCFRSKFHDGPIAFSNNETNMAYTRNAENDHSKDKVVELQIWFSNYENEKWTKETPFLFNSPDYSVGHPFLTEDGKTMYFASDMPGGFGKADLYKTTKNESGEWTKPINLGNTINTEGDELFPFLNEKNQLLFFTSTGHFGLGGMDIFRATMTGSNFQEVKNLGAPVNTAQDDYAMIINDDMTKGYFSTNRKNGNDDIYYANFSDGINSGKHLEGIAMDKDEKPLAGIFVTLTDESGLMLDTLTTGSDGFYKFHAASDKNFKLVGTKVNYIDGKNLANTFGEDITVIANLTLLIEETEEYVKEPIKIEEELVDYGKPILFNPIYFDLNKYSIDATAAIELDKMITVLNKNPEMEIVLGSYADCRSSEEYNQLLSERRAQATIDYIKKRITNPERITGIGYGESEPVNSCIGEGDITSDCTEVQHSKNRRTEFLVVVNNLPVNSVKL